MREHLIALIEAAVADKSRRHLVFTLMAGNGPIPRHPVKANDRFLRFGYEFYGPDRATLGTMVEIGDGEPTFAPDDHGGKVESPVGEIVPVADGVDRFLAATDLDK